MKHCGTEILNGPNIAMDTSYAMVTTIYTLIMRGISDSETK